MGQNDKYQYRYPNTIRHSGGWKHVFANSVDEAMAQGIPSSVGRETLEVFTEAKWEKVVKIPTDKGGLK